MQTDVQATYVNDRRGLWSLDNTGVKDVKLSAEPEGTQTCGGVVDQTIPQEWCGTAAQEGPGLQHSTQLMLPRTALPAPNTHPSAVTSPVEAVCHKEPTSNTHMLTTPRCGKTPAALA